LLTTRWQGIASATEVGGAGIRDGVNRPRFTDAAILGRID
jgi:hypothetical protein